MKRACLVTALILTLAACTAEGPDGGAGGGSGAGVDAGITGGGTQDVPLTLDQVPTSTQWNSIPVSGTGPEGGTLIIDTDAVGEKAQTIDDSGNFCIDVPLDPGASNHIDFQAIDGDGARSEVVSIEVAQQGQPPEPTPDPEPMRNILHGSTDLRTTVNIDAGQLAQLVDGNYTDDVELSNAFWDDDYLWIQTKEIASVDHVRIKTTDDCPMTEYIVGESEDGSDPVNYYEIAHVTDGTSDYTAQPPDNLAGIRAHWLLIWFKSGDCGSWYGPGHHKLIEVEAWTDDQGPGGPPADSTPTCATGG